MAKKLPKLPEPKWGTVDRFCAKTDTSRRTAYRLMQQGLLEFIKVGPRRRVRMPEEREGATA
jgi:excisionase family DNA binding protein